MRLGSRASIAIAAALSLAGIGLAGSAVEANPVDPSFGPIAFHQAPVQRRIVVEPQQIREHPGKPFADWIGYSTFPDFTQSQKDMIHAAKGSAKGGGHGGGHGGGGGGGGGTATVPYWESQITSPLDGQSYTMSMVGSSPYASSPSSTTITYVPIVLQVTINNVTYDPTQPACDDTVPVQDRFFNSPLFYTGGWNSNGTVVTDQFASAFQRANFWSKVAGTSYGVELAPSVANPIVVSVSLRGTNYNLTCSNGKKINLGAVSINSFDSAIQGIIAQYSTPGQLPIVLTYNIVETSGGCCILGYHNAVPVSGGVQTYATGAYVDGGIFTNTDDVSVWTHEIGEWLDDPFVQASVAGGGSDDLTPAWGHVGQVSTCQNNLEVGDPLTGTEANTGVFNGYIYHVQDLAFKDWFYRTPSEGTGGMYSFLGSFDSVPPAC